jgi:hypothetical protein
MRFSRKGSVAILLLTSAVVALAQSPHAAPASKKNALHRANELTLAGLRPGRDSMAQARKLYRKIDPKSSTHDTETVWLDRCGKVQLTVDFDSDQRIQVIRAAESASSADCASPVPSAWKTGHGLRVGDAATRVAELYGEPDSRSPSTKGGQPLELWYYAFDWAGADVPQVMEVLCTAEQNGGPGRVVEITLAAPSL